MPCGFEGKPEDEEGGSNKCLEATLMESVYSPDPISTWRNDG